MGYLDSTGLTHLWEKVKTALTRKQNTLTTDDSLSIQEDTISVTTPVKGVTQAEYNVLSEDEKDAGLYIVTDANMNLNDRGDVYSTEETRIGTWIDGKPLYRKVYSMNNGSSLTGDWSKVFDVSAININEVVLITGSYVQPQGPTKSLGRDIFARYYDGYIWLWSNDGPQKSVCLTVEYTKSTDTVPANQAALLSSKVELPDKLTLNFSASASAPPLTVTFPSAGVRASASSAASYAGLKLQGGVDP